MNGLPKGWINICLGDVAAFIMGQAPPGKECNSEGKGTVFVKAGEFSTQYPNIREWTTKPLKMARSGDVLICVVGATAGKLNLAIDCAIGRSVAAIRPLDGIPTKFILFQLQPKVLSLRGASVGSAQGVISKEDLSTIPFSLPPLNEQRRIVAKLERLLSRVDTTQDRLATIPHILKRFRQSVLAAACSGRLTIDWREANQVRIEDWSEVIVNEVAELRLGKMLDKAKNVGEPTPYLRNLNVRWFGFDLSDLALIKATDQDKAEFSIRDGDVLICEGGEPGRCAVWQGGPQNLIFQKALHRARLHDSVLPEWLVMNIRNDAISGRLEQFFTGSTIRHLTGQSLATYSFGRPSGFEQQEIVRRVEALFNTADALEGRYLKAKAHVDKLTQSILAKAFRGELVPQDPTDEPASVLLERIHQQRNGTSGPKARSTTKRSRR